MAKQVDVAAHSLARPGHWIPCDEINPYPAEKCHQNRHDEQTAGGQKQPKVASIAPCPACHFGSSIPHPSWVAFGHSWAHQNLDFPGFHRQAGGTPLDADIGTTATDGIHVMGFLRNGATAAKAAVGMEATVWRRRTRRRNEHAFTNHIVLTADAVKRRFPGPAGRDQGRGSKRGRSPA